MVLVKTKQHHQQRNVFSSERADPAHHPLRSEDWESVWHALNSVEIQKTHVILPKFSIRSNHHLTPAFEGDPHLSAFMKEMNLSHMTPNASVLDIDVVQDAVVDVDEEGTRAAAVTTIQSFGSAAPVPPPRQFKADRPFHFMILEKETQSVLFIGVVSDPTG
eukprot:gb/GECH01008263.1/.p1 GENE.gb/GECH01008263.1/~~gb/GECH01008263.1/.p1  ORF type:complete len:162 (+),score=38.70 gb/GECH01008263.1/:1-486(+)